MKNMKHISILALLFTFLSVFNFSYGSGPLVQPDVAYTIPAKDSVYICENGKTVVYHTNQNCSALKRCTHTVHKTTKDKATSSGKRQCKTCNR